MGIMKGVDTMYTIIAWTKEQDGRGYPIQRKDVYTCKNYKLEQNAVILEYSEGLVVIPFTNVCKISIKEEAQN